MDTIKEREAHDIYEEVLELHPDIESVDITKIDGEYKVEVTEFDKAPVSYAVDVNYSLVPIEEKTDEPNIENS